MTKTQKDRVLDHLEEHGTITSWEAIQNYGITRLSEYIRQLRLDGYMIASNWTENINRYGDKVRYVIYEMKEER